MESYIYTSPERTPLTPLRMQRVKFGCDPEFFFTNKGKIIESEKIISEEGLKAKYNNNKIIVDGIQAEFNPLPSDCREGLADHIINCFKTIAEQIKDDKDISTDFSQTIEVTKKQFDEIDDKAKKFGCDSSYNTNGDSKSEIKINPDTYRKRSAGGHIHLGRSDPWNLEIAGALGSPERLVPLLDMLVGNTCVLLDRDEGNIERRKVYGKAGEYRTPKHGLEYRTLSNFWLKSYPLMSLVMGLSRVAVNVVAYDREAERQLLRVVNMRDIEKAINENDFDLAMSNFEKIEPLLLDLAGNGRNNGMTHPITVNTITQFKRFVKNGIDHYFKDDPMTHWLGKGENGRGYGWENFISRISMIDKIKTILKKKIV